MAGQTGRLKSLFYITPLGFLLFSWSVSFAQDRPVGETRQPGESRPALPDYLLPKTERDFVLPPAPKSPATVSQKALFELQGVVFEGNTVFPDPQLKAVAEPFLGRTVSLADVEELRYRLTRLYVDAGYINSGAVLKPNQNVDDGVVTFTILEGRLTDVRISGKDGHLRPSYVQKRLRPHPVAVFNVLDLQKRFQMLLEDPLIQRMDGRIRPGARPGEAILDLNITEASLYEASLTIDNHRPPSVGAEGGILRGAVRNLSGWGDRLEVAFDAGEGAREFSFGYTLPLTYQGTRLTLGLNRSDSTVIQEPLASLDIESEEQGAALTVTHPLYKTLGRNFEIGASLAVRKSETFLLNRPFSFSPGTDDGKSQITALRLTQSFLDRKTKHALALRSTLSIGIDLFGATIGSDSQPDGQFVTWLGQLQYAYRIGDRWGQLIFRCDLQLSANDLLPLEKFALGGTYTVRGYRENAMVRDNGSALSAEWRYPLWDGSIGNERRHLIQLASFMDFGMSWNKGEDPGDHRLHSAGIGLLWKTKRFDAAIYFAHSIEETASYEEHDLQDDGIHFSFRIHFF